MGDLTQTKVENLMTKIWAEMELEREKSHPKGLHFPKGARYRFYHLKTGKKRTVKGITFAPQIRFCYSVHPNHAGFWVAWVDTVRASGKVIRNGWTFNKSKKLILEHALQEYKKAKAKVKPV